MKKWLIISASLAVVAALVAFWLLEGRFLVEGGRVAWAAVNRRHDVLEKALAANPSPAELRKALRHAASREDLVALKLLIAAKAPIDLPRKGRCMVASALRFGRPGVALALLDAGAKIALCQESAATIAVNTLRYGHGRTPQGNLNRLLAHLLRAEPSLDREPLRIEARRAGLAKVMTFLAKPTPLAQTPVETVAPKITGVAGSVSWDDLKQVCGGKARATAAPYVRSEQGTATVVSFERRFTEWRRRGRGPNGVPLPLWWTDFREPANNQLVVCVDAVEKQKAKVCRYKGKGGGVTIYDATWDMTLYEAKTGRKVAAKRLPMRAPRRCPTLKWGRHQEGIFPPYTAALKVFLAPHVGGPS